MKVEYIISLIILALVAVGLVILLSSSDSNDSSSKNNLPKGEPYKEIVKPAGFVNTGDQPIKIADYVGKKVIMLDVMTYSCINCQRTFPYVTGWYEKYKDQGFIVIGIHTPEFAFEKNKGNVAKAMKEFGINFPVVLDNDYGTWNAYGNRYWPRKYLIDIKGNIVYDHIGEGAYEETEMKIRYLLKERVEFLGESQKNTDDSLASSLIPKKNVLAQSPETYFGSLRNEYLGNGAKGQRGQQTFTIPERKNLNTLYLGGTWNINPEYAESVQTSTEAYRYNAKEVYLVATASESLEIEVWQDGALVGVSAGEDVDTKGVVNIQESKLYKLISNTEPGEHTLKLRIKGKGVLLYAFTF